MGQLKKFRNCESFQKERERARKSNAKTNAKTNYDENKSKNDIDKREAIEMKPEKQMKTT